MLSCTHEKINSPTSGGIRRKETVEEKVEKRTIGSNESGRDSKMEESTNDYPLTNRDMTTAYKNDPELKKALLREITNHEKADAITQGTYGRQNGPWKGCAVACSLRSYAIVNKEELVTKYNQHAKYDEIFGPGGQTIGQLEDRIFEGMTAKDAKTFPRKFIQAINPGADLSLVPARFLKWVVEDTLNNFDNENNPEVVKAIQGVVQLWQDVIDGKYKGKDKDLESAAWSAWSAAESAESAGSAGSAARSAAWSAARSAARSVAWSVAESAARSAESVAGSAAWSAESVAGSAAGSAARSAARSAAYKKQADYLLKLLAEAPITNE